MRIMKSAEQADFRSRNQSSRNQSTNFIHTKDGKQSVSLQFNVPVKC